MTTVELSLSVRFIAGGILDRFPRRSLVIAHFGGGIAAVKDRLSAKGYRFGTLKRSFVDYFEMLYFDLAGLKAVCRLCTALFKASGRSD